MHARILPPTSVGGTCILADVGIKSIPGSIIVLESESAFVATHLDHRSLPSLADGHHTRRSHRIAGVPYSHTEYSVLVGRSTRLMWLFGIPWSLLVSCSNVWRYIAQDTAAFIVSCLPPNSIRCRVVDVAGWKVRVCLAAYSLGRYIPQTPRKPFFFFLHTLRKIRRIEMVYSDNKATMIHQLALSGECTWQQTPKLKRRHRGNEVAHVC